jgi:hypothetical protein
MNTVTVKNERVSIPKNEYLRLKNLDRRFRGFFEYTKHLIDVGEARADIKNKKIIPQEKLFGRLGI